MSGVKLLDTFSAAIFAGVPPPPRVFLDKSELLPVRNVTLLSGDGATGKSLLALQLAIAVVSESLWIGIEVGFGPCVYLCCEEDRDELHNRLADIANAEGVDLADCANLEIACLTGQDASLVYEERRGGLLKTTPLFSSLAATLENIEPVLVIIDNLADIFSGNENDRSLVKHFITVLRGLALRTDCAVLLLAHPSLSGLANGSGMSGSTAWSNSVRSRLYLRRDVDADGSEADDTQRLLEVKKLNYGPMRQPYGLRWRDGRFIRADLPKPFDDVSVADLDRVKAAFRTAAYRVDERAGDWGGYLVAEILDLDVGRGIGPKERSREQIRARDKVRKVLAVWLQNKAISIVEGRTERREKTQVYHVPGANQ